MLLLVVDLTTVILYFVVCQTKIWKSYNVFKTHLHVLFLKQLVFHILHLHWLPIRYHSIFKTLTIVYKCLNTGLPKKFVPFISIYVCQRNTRHSKPGKYFLQKPTYDSSVHTSKVHFDNSFAFDGPNLWNNLAESTRCAPSLLCFRNRVKTYLFEQAFPP